MVDEVGTRAPSGLRARERRENFPVAMRILPRRPRTHLRAVYDVARSVDDLGDVATGDRLALLDAYQTDLERIWTGGMPTAPQLRRLAHTVRDCLLPRQPFLDLIEANRWDQRITRYGTHEQLLAYCALSANPVGRIVLGIAAGIPGNGRSPINPVDAALSDRICTALQLVEHWQDVAEDRRAGRVYLPAEDLEAYAVTEADLDRVPTPARVRRLLAHETDRAAALLDAGAPLVGRLHGWARLAVAGYVAGGRAAVDGLRRVGFDVLPGTPPTRRRDVLRHATRLLLPGGTAGERPGGERPGGGGGTPPARAPGAAA